MNLVIPDAGQQTDCLAKKTARGKQTTRTTELFTSGDIDLIDSPGFFVFDELPIDSPEELAAYYPEFADCKCWFAPCLHVSEPDCGVKEAVEAGRINERRYKRYVILTQEIKERKEHKYD